MLDYIYKSELISNFYITFYGSEIIKDDQSSINLDDNDIMNKILHKLNTNQIINIVYNNTTIDKFTEFFSKLLKAHFRMKLKNDRLNLCITNKIIVNPNKI
jgi:hypothetical protein